MGQPLVNLDGTPWSVTNSNLMFLHIRRNLIDELNARDEGRGAGGPATIDDGEKLVVDPVKSRLKYTGEEYSLLLQKRWAEYKAQRRDESKELAPLRDKLARDAFEKAVSAGAAVEESLIAPPTVENVESPKTPPLTKGVKTGKET